MSRSNQDQSSLSPTILEMPAAGLHSDYEAGATHLSCSTCAYPLECVEQNRRSGTWLGSFICPNCRSEYFYAYRWGRLTRKF